MNLYDLYLEWVAQQQQKNQWHESAFTSKASGEGWITDEEGEMVTVWDTSEEGIAAIQELMLPKATIWYKGITQERLRVCYPNLYSEFLRKMEQQGIVDYSSFDCFSIKIENGKPVQCVID